MMEQFMRCYSFLKPEEKFLSTEDLFKKRNPTILSASMYLGNYN